MKHERTTAVIATHIAPALGYGGVSVAAATLTRAWGKKGHRIVLCASDESVGGRLRPGDVKLGPQVDVRLYHCYWFRRWGFGLGAVPAVFATCRDANTAYIHGIATWPSTLGAIYCTLLRRRFVVAPRGGLMPDHVAFIRREKPHKWLFYKVLTFPALRRAIAIHCTSEIEANGVRQVLGNDARILLIPNGIDCEEVKMAVRRIGKGTTICFLGHIQREKGINAFLRAWLKVRGPEDRMVICGRSADSDYFDEFQALVLEAEGAIDYRGYLSRNGVVDVLTNSDFLVLPSGLEEAGGMRENFGNVVAEAMAAGRPVLVAQGLAWDNVEALGIGFVFERTEAAAGHAVRRAQSLSESEWRRMGTQARFFAEQHLDAGRLADQIWQKLNAAVAGT